MDYQKVIQTFLHGKYLALAPMNYMDDETIEPGKTNNIIGNRNQNKKSKKYLKNGNNLGQISVIPKNGHTCFK